MRTNPYQIARILLDRNGDCTQIDCEYCPLRSRQRCNIDANRKFLENFLNNLRTEKLKRILNDV